jgi:hypothetical protein
VAPWLPLTALQGSYARWANREPSICEVCTQLVTAFSKGSVVTVDCTRCCVRLCATVCAETERCRLCCVLMPAATIARSPSRAGSNYKTAYLRAVCSHVIRRVLNGKGTGARGCFPASASAPGGPTLVATSVSARDTHPSQSSLLVCGRTVTAFPQARTTCTNGRTTGVCSPGGLAAAG